MKDKYFILQGAKILFFHNYSLCMFIDLLAEEL